MDNNYFNEKTSESLQKKYEQLHEDYEKERLTTKTYERSLIEIEQTFKYAKRSRLIHLLDPSGWKQRIRHTGAYLLGKRNIKRLYSRTYKRKQVSNDLLPYVRLLYEEGFTERALADLEEMFQTTSNKYLQRAVAAELALYYANEENEIAAKLALPYVKFAKSNERNSTLRRQLSIIEAECYTRIGKSFEAKKVLNEELKTEKHPDLYLALSNTEKTLDKKITWLNKTLQLYDRQPIQLDLVDKDVTNITYDVLNQSKATGKEKTGPKISVILPSYNCEDRIHIAIESILKQTWINLELIIVDDCSTDNTFEVIEHYALQDERIRFFKNPKNSGPYVARNLALQNATGEFVTVNDADDWSHEEKLEVQVTHLLNHPEVIANTSEQSRITTDFYFHRRGTRGKYIFSNMSSLMFRREEVVKRVGYWDAVRFAADGEFKRRLIREFGEKYVVDLQTGPLSLPEQSAKSLTGSSSFGYSGYFMGARKEYVESFTHYHKIASNLYYPNELKKRLFSVPQPMLPERERGDRNVDVVIVANFYNLSKERANSILQQIEINKRKNITTGLVQLYDYDVKLRKRTFYKNIREIIDGTSVQMLVFGEKINSQIVFVHTVESLMEKQVYLPKINTRVTIIIIDVLPNITYNGKRESNYNVRQIIRQARDYFSSELRVYPKNETIRKELETKYKKDFGTIRLAKEDWFIDYNSFSEIYLIRLNDWFVEKNDFELK